MGAGEEAISRKRNNVPELDFISELKWVKDQKMEGTSKYENDCGAWANDNSYIIINRN